MSKKTILLIAAGIVVYLVFFKKDRKAVNPQIIIGDLSEPTMLTKTP